MKKMFKPLLLIAFLLNAHNLMAQDRYDGHRDRDVEFAIDDGKAEPELVFVDKDKEAHEKEMERRRQKAFAKKIARGTSKVLKQISQKKAAIAYKRAQKLRKNQMAERDRLAANGLADQIAAQTKRAEAARAKQEQIAAQQKKLPFKLFKNKKLEKDESFAAGLPVVISSATAKQRLMVAFRKRVAQRAANGGRSVASVKKSLKDAVSSQQKAVGARAIAARDATQNKMIAARGAHNNSTVRAPASASEQGGFFQSIADKVKVRYLQVKSAINGFFN